MTPAAQSVQHDPKNKEEKLNAAKLSFLQFSFAAPRQSHRQTNLTFRLSTLLTEDTTKGELQQKLSSVYKFGT